MAKAICMACGGGGVMFDTQGDAHYCIERCDSCKRFRDDIEAGNYLQRLVRKDTEESS